MLEPAPTTANTIAVKAFNEQVRSDERVEQVMLPLGDGMTIARTLP